MNEPSLDVIDQFINRLSVGGSPSGYCWLGDRPLSPPTPLVLVQGLPDQPETVPAEKRSENCRLEFKGLSIPLSPPDIVAIDGCSWLPDWTVNAQLTSPSEPYTLLEARLPKVVDPLVDPNGEPFNPSTRPIEFEQVAPSSTQKTDAALNTQEELSSSGIDEKPLWWSSTSSTVTVPPSKLAENEAATGTWLSDYESGSFKRVLAPGMPRGAFGDWAVEQNVARPGTGGSIPPGTQEDTPSRSTLPQLRSTINALKDTETQGKKEEQQATVKLQMESLFQGMAWLEGEEEAGGEEAGEGEEAGQQQENTVPSDSDTNFVKRLDEIVERRENPQEEHAELMEDDDAQLSNFLTSQAVQQPGGAAPWWTLDSSQIHNYGTSIIKNVGFWPGSRIGQNQRGTKKSWATRATINDLDRQWSYLLPVMARQYPFELDTFQKEAILHMEAGHSVFIAAHTSAGKTVAAEYAFALAMKHCTRAVYTSPIKTISNQKFRDFSSESYGFEVGLLTGDVSIRPESSCLIMTTEILRSMLYKGADMVRDIEWVIFDEVHYVNDAERGVVWEEVIIMLPEHVNLVLLSATVPNVMEFADWVGRTKRQVVYVTGTTKRPVPLEHKLYYSGKLYTICTPDGYDPKGFKAARDVNKQPLNSQAVTKPPQTKAMGKSGGVPADGKTHQRQEQKRSQTQHPTRSQQQQRLQQQQMQFQQRAYGPSGEKTRWSELIFSLRKQELLPMVGFCFSKRRCDAIADSLASLDMTTAAEKSEIHVFCDKALARLKGSDKQLPQVLRVREMLKRGIGVHHAGLLPIVKEMVEMLFCRGIIRALFSTETFAMGVNAPARTVVFQSLRKHDGRQFRTLLPGEYTQMAGRAGRRGLDKVGTVIIAAWDELPEETEVRRLLTGAATKLESQFRLTYSMILNLLRVEDLKVEDMMKRSFAEFHAQKAIPDGLVAIKKGEAALRRLRNRTWPASPLGTTREEVVEYVDMAMAADALGQQVQRVVMASRGVSTALVEGRVVLVRCQDTFDTSGAIRWELGVVVEQHTSSVLNSSHRGSRCTMLILCPETSSEKQGDAANKPLHRDNESTPTPDELGLPFAKQLRIQADNDDKDDDLAMFMGSKRSKGSSKGSKGSSKSLSSKPKLALPYFGSVGAIHYVIEEVEATSPDSRIDGIYKHKLRVDGLGVVSGDQLAIAAAVTALNDLKSMSDSSQMELMDPIADLKVQASLDLASDIRERQRILHTLPMLPCFKDPILPEMVSIVRSEKVLSARLAKIAESTGDAGLMQLPEFQARLAFLQQTGYLDEDTAVTLKGRVACEINSGDEIVGTEMVFCGILNNLEPEEAVSLLSALVFQEKSECEPSLPSKLQEAKEETAALAYRAGQQQQEVGLANIIPEDFVKATLNFGLMEVVYEWAKGTPFNEICTLTDVMEGSIVRTIVRLDETCREFRDAARVMGNTNLYQQMEDASMAIKRDIVFAASLYVS